MAEGQHKEREEGKEEKEETDVFALSTFQMSSIGRTKSGSNQYPGAPQAFHMGGRAKNLTNLLVPLCKHYQVLVQKQSIQDLNWYSHMECEYSMRYPNLLYHRPPTS